MATLQQTPFNTSTSLNTSEIVIEDHCLFKQQKGSSSFDGPFIWNKKIQGLILSSYFYGYITTQVFFFLYFIHTKQILKN